MAAYPAYTIGRVLEYGDDEDVAWLRTNFPAVEITEVVRNERRLSRRSANFWALLYGIPADAIALALSRGALDRASADGSSLVGPSF